MTYKELVYLVLDELKLTSDDSLINENHVIFLLSKYRNFILKQRYSDIKKPIPESNYQTICLDLQVTDNIEGLPCAGSTLKSIQQIPNLMKIGNQKVYPTDYFQGEITLVSRERLRYVGHNKYLKNIIYCAIGPDKHLYFKSQNPNHLYLRKVRMTGIFDDVEKASELQCSDNNENNCDILDREFPLESALVPTIVELIVKELSSTIYQPQDEENDANDNLSEIKTK